MTAIVHDPDGPRHRRFLLRLVALEVAVWPLFTGGVTVYALPFMLLVGALLAVNARRLLGRLRPRQATLSVGEGRIDVRGAGILDQRIRADRLVAASVVEGRGRTSFALQRAGGGVPLLLEVDAPSDAQAIRAALGLRAGGFGEVVWPLGEVQEAPKRRRRALRASAFALLAAPILLYCCYAALFAFGPGAFLFVVVIGVAALGTFPVALILLLAEALTARRSVETLTLDSRSLLVRTRDAKHVLRHSSVRHASVVENGLAIEQSFTRSFVAADVGERSAFGMSPEHLEHVAAFIQEAARRSIASPRRGEGTTGLLARRASETQEAWRARVETLSTAPANYRVATLDEGELWDALDDPDAEPELQLAAARLLMRGEDRGGQEAVLRSVRDPHVRRALKRDAA
jgi:hypothetical protein